jgi:hypothetical protein
VHVAGGRARGQLGREDVDPVHARGFLDHLLADPVAQVSACIANRLETALMAAHLRG